MLKHCEVRTYQHFPFDMEWQSIPYNLRSGCPSNRPTLLHGNIALWKQIVDGTITGENCLNKPIQNTGRLRGAGVHLTSYGT